MGGESEAVNLEKWRCEEWRRREVKEALFWQLPATTQHFTPLVRIAVGYDIYESAVILGTLKCLQIIWFKKNRIFY